MIIELNKAAGHVKRYGANNYAQNFESMAKSIETELRSDYGHLKNLIKRSKEK